MARNEGHQYRGVLYKGKPAIEEVRLGGSPPWFICEREVYDRVVAALETGRDFGMIDQIEKATRDKSKKDITLYKIGVCLRLWIQKGIVQKSGGSYIRLETTFATDAAVVFDQVSSDRRE